MTRDEQLIFCRKCINRKNDTSKGIICQITSEKASFEIECSDFERDTSVKELPLNDEVDFNIDEIKKKLSPEVYNKLLAEQNLKRGIIGGSVVGLIGAILWGIISVSTGNQFGLMAVIIGAGVGLSMRILGKGLSNIFGIYGAAIAFLSVVLGNIFSIIGFVAHMENISYFETLIWFNYSILPSIMAKTFSFFDIIFYTIALAQGFKFSFRPITEKRIHELREKHK